MRNNTSEHMPKTGDWPATMSVLTADLDLLTLNEEYQMKQIVRGNKHIFESKCVWVRKSYLYAWV
jgi:hypothetical protein